MKERSVFRGKMKNVPRPGKRNREVKGFSSEGLREIWKGFQDWAGRLGRKPKIGIALGGGAAWGVAHIGVFSGLQELGIPVSYLSGTSSGSFVGALYAGGIKGKQLEQCGLQYRWRDAGRLQVLPKAGLASNDRMTAYLERKIGHPRFEDLGLPFYVTATNLKTGKLRIFNRGPVIPAVRASCAVPGIFAPVEIEGDLYCDGGLLSRIPCRILREAGADLVIGVELGILGMEKNVGNIFEVINRAFDIAVISQVNQETEAADLMIHPKLTDLNEFAFNQGKILIERGKEATVRQLKNWDMQKFPIRSTREKSPRSTT